MDRRIVWTIEARNSRKKIFEYWNQRNKSKFYSKKLNLLFKESLQLASTFPDSGIPTQFKDIKLTIVSHFEIIYKVTQSEIVVLDIWDSRQNPQHFPLR
jgi:addiction module RelE/StbE family toxin